MILPHVFFVITHIVRHVFLLNEVIENLPAHLFTLIVYLFRVSN